MFPSSLGDLKEECVGSKDEKHHSSYHAHGFRLDAAQQQLPSHYRQKRADKIPNGAADEYYTSRAENRGTGPHGIVPRQEDGCDLARVSPLGKEVESKCLKKHAGIQPSALVLLLELLLCLLLLVTTRGTEESRILIIPTTLDHHDETNDGKLWLISICKTIQAIPQ